MSDHGEDYERIVRSLLLSKFATGTAAQLHSFHQKHYTGKSGQDHEIDVSFEVEFTGVKLVVLVECKDYGRKVGVDDVMTFVYRLHDIGAHKGLLVTTRGFQSGAVTVAKAEGIGLLLAARGVVEVYSGREYTAYEHWISYLEREVSADAHRVNVVGKRYVEGNCHSRVVSLHTAQAGLEFGMSALAFLTDQEESQLESQPQGRPRAFLGTYGRAISSIKDSRTVVVC